MLLTTTAIVLSKIKYNDHDLIIKCYTQKKGIVSYLLKRVLKPKKGSKIAYYQLLSQLEIETNHKNSRNLQYIKEVKIKHLYSTLHTNVLKSSITMFLAEILSYALQEEEENNILYNYLETTLLWLDTNDNISNFHLLFLLELTKHLGFYPDKDTISGNYFNMNAGKFQDTNDTKYCISGENLTLLKTLLGTTFDALETIKIHSKQRQSFLNFILLYFELHLGSFKKPKSLQIFNDVFN